MKQWTTVIAAVMILAACDAMPTTPEGPVPSATQTSLSPSLLLVLAPPQEVLIDRAERGEESAWFHAEIVVARAARQGNRRGFGFVEMNSESDGLLQIRVKEARVDADDAVHFTGLATLRTESGERVAEFPIAGTARPEPGHPDCIIWDIFGGNVYDGAAFESEGRLFTPGGLFARGG